MEESFDLVDRNRKRKIRPGRHVTHRPDVVYWIWRIDPKSERIVIIGWWETEEEASQVGFSKLGGVFNIHKTRTINRAEATSEIKGKRFFDTNRIEDIIRRARHPKED